MAFISLSNPSKRCFMISQSSISLPGTMVTNIFSFSLIHCSTPSPSVNNLYKLSASKSRCFRSFASSWSSWYLKIIVKLKSVEKIHWWIEFLRFWGYHVKNQGTRLHFLEIFCSFCSIGTKELLYNWISTFNLVKMCKKNASQVWVAWWGCAHTPYLSDFHLSFSKPYFTDVILFNKIAIPESKLRLLQ